MPEVVGDDPVPVDVPVAPVPEVPAVEPVPEVPAVEPVPEVPAVEPVPEVPAVEPLPVENVVPTNTDAYAVGYKTYFVFPSERQDST